MSDEDKAKIGYPVAIQMIAYEGQIIWRSFSAMVVANTAIVALAGFKTQVLRNPFGRRVIPVLGLVICICWLLVTFRQYSSYKYWFACARELESYFGPVVQTVTRGADFAAGRPVRCGRKVQKQSCAGIFKVRWLTYIVISTFILMYIFILIPGFE